MRVMLALVGGVAAWYISFMLIMVILSYSGIEASSPVGVFWSLAGSIFIGAGVFLLLLRRGRQNRSPTGR
jgi:hypothetical protein